ncbi:sensor histidine kinase [Facklamia sp. P12945]|uniref:sensor histidine kinase n=1 Tax=Facklamia sp. P12945 TaxID=3421950 RepID=UPI003D16E2AC
MKAFINEYRGLILFVLFILALFALVFYLFHLNWMHYLIPSLLIVLILVLYLGRQWFYFQMEVSYQVKFQTLLESSLVEKNIQLNREKDLEDYFLLWVHQIKTPIAASKMLLEESDDPSKGLLNQELVKIESYSNLALNYLKVTNPKRDMVFSRVQLNEIIQPLLKRYRHQFINQEITLHYQPIDQAILTEANLCQIMIEQILFNALKYSPKGNIWIKWRQASYDLVIEDDGRGIHSQDLPKIFDKGYSGHNGLLNEQSSGIGLYMVQLISKRLNQAVSVQSKKGEGSRFIIQFNQEMS